MAAALDAGYRHIDTAKLYANEERCRRRPCASPASTATHVFVTSKVWNDDQGYDATLRAFDASWTGSASTCSTCT